VASDGAPADAPDLLDGAGPSDPTLPALTFIDEPDTPCSARGGTVRELFAAGPSSPSFDALGRVGARRWAEGRDATGFITFDADGASPSALVAPFARGNKVVALGDALLVAGSNGTSLQVARYDANGAPMGGAADVAPDDSNGMALASGGDRALVLWGGASGLRARGVKADGTFAGEAFLAHAAPAYEFFAAAAKDGDGDFAIAWSGSSGQGYSTYFLRTSLTEKVQRASLLTRTGTPWRVVQLVRLPAGFGLLLQGATGAAVAALDDNGRPVGPARRLVGTSRALGLAASGDQMGVVAWRLKTTADGDGEVRDENDAVEFRSFDARGAPRGAWVCLDGPTRLDFSMSAGIDGETNGYAVVYRTPASAVAFARFDRNGTGSQ
jgi:hypothetical protein